jgi:hypothetical protein
MEKLKNEGKSTKGVKRELNKKVFNNHIKFFCLFFEHWVNNPSNSKQMEKFYNDFRIMFLKTARFHAIDARLWEEK